jgi:hypothetical protein
VKEVQREESVDTGEQRDLPNGLCCQGIFGGWLEWGQYGS